jgi:hypothetical protein
VQELCFDRLCLLLLRLVLPALFLCLLLEHP